jgi:hypothetical protein
MGIAAGGFIKQSIWKDTLRDTNWDESRKAFCNVLLLNADLVKYFKGMEGLTLPRSLIPKTGSTITGLDFNCVPHAPVVVENFREILSIAQIEEDNISETSEPAANMVLYQTSSPSGLTSSEPSSDPTSTVATTGVTSDTGSGGPKRSGKLFSLRRLVSQVMKRRPKGDSPAKVVIRVPAKDVIRVPAEDTAREDLWRRNNGPVDDPLRTSISFSILASEIALEASQRPTV